MLPHPPGLQIPPGLQVQPQQSSLVNLNSKYLKLSNQFRSEEESGQSQNLRTPSEIAAVLQDIKETIFPSLRIRSTQIVRKLNQRRVASRPHSSGMVSRASFRNQEKGVLAKGFSQRLADYYRTIVYVYMYRNMAPNVPTSDQPMSLNIVSLSEFNLSFQGRHVSWLTELLARLPSARTAQPSTKVKNHLCRSRVCLCRLPCASRRASCCTTSFDAFPRISATFRDFPPPSLSATFRTLRWRSRKKSGNFPHNFRKCSKCSVHCMGVVALRSGARGAQLKRTR